MFLSKHNPSVRPSANRNLIKRQTEVGLSCSLRCLSAGGNDTGNFPSSSFLWLSAPALGPSAIGFPTLSVWLLQTVKFRSQSLYTLQIWWKTFYSPANYDSTLSPPAESSEKNRAQCFISYSNLGISDDEMTKSLTESYKVTFSFLILVSWCQPAFVSSAPSPNTVPPGSVILHCSSHRSAHRHTNTHRANKSQTFLTIMPLCATTIKRSRWASKLRSSFYA